jgi:hypothetical protein
MVSKYIEKLTVTGDRSSVDETPLAGLGHKLSIGIIVPPLGVAVGEIFYIEL